MAGSDTDTGELAAADEAAKAEEAAADEAVKVETGCTLTKGSIGEKRRG
jgi:hypothetical protein